MTDDFFRPLAAPVTEACYRCGHGLMYYPTVEHPAPDCAGDWTAPITARWYVRVCLIMTLGDLVDAIEPEPTPEQRAEASALVAQEAAALAWVYEL